MTRPSATRNQWLWVTAKVRPVGGKAQDRARDIVWTLISADIYRLLVVERGWSLSAYETWLAETLITALTPFEPRD